MYTLLLLQLLLYCCHYTTTMGDLRVLTEQDLERRQQQLKHDVVGYRPEVRCETGAVDKACQPLSPAIPSHTLFVSQVFEFFEPRKVTQRLCEGRHVRALLVFCSRPFALSLL